jgi:hypothetical protein
LVGDIASDFFLSLFMESVEVPDKQWMNKTKYGIYNMHNTYTQYYIP